MLNTRLIKILASLGLTVVCLAFGIVLVFWGTLAQVHLGLYQAQHQFFRSFFIFWQLPDSDLKMPVFPGGYLIGGVLLINLIAAHATRFQLKWRKSGIILSHFGLILLLLGLLLTDVLSTESSMRLNVGETRNYSEDFRENELAVVNTTSPDSEQVVTFSESAVARQGDIGNAGLPVKFRVKDYWANCDVFERPPEGAKSTGAKQGQFSQYLVLPIPPESRVAQTGAATVVEVTGGKEIIGPLLVSTIAEEPEKFSLNGQWQMSLATIPEMGGSVLLITSSRRSPADQPTPVREGELKAGNEIAPLRAPFRLRVLQFWPRCKLYRKPTSKAVFPQVTQGAFTSVTVEPLPPSTVEDQRNQPAAVVEVISPKGPLGTWLLSTAFRVKQGFPLDGSAYEVAFQYKRHYQPFNITLLNATHTKYPGTEIPKDFRSRVRVQSEDSGEIRESEIYMNAPLRFAGFTFFQYQMAADDGVIQAGGHPSSTFQVVKNPGWLTPYIACALVFLGLLVQFMLHLSEFLGKRRPA